MMIACAHQQTKKFGKNRNGSPRVRCCQCGKTWTIQEPKPLGNMYTELEKAKLVLNLLTQGMSIRATERVTGVHAIPFASSSSTSAMPASASWTLACAA